MGSLIDYEKKNSVVAVVSIILAFVLFSEILLFEIAVIISGDFNSRLFSSAL